MIDTMTVSNKSPLRSYKAYLAYFLAAMYLFYEMGVQVSPSMMTDVLMRDMGVNAAVLLLHHIAAHHQRCNIGLPAGVSPCHQLIFCA